MKLNLTKNLEPAKTEKIAQIDTDANRALESYRTSSNIAVAAYALKRDEVSAADAGVALNDLAMLQAEAQATGLEPEKLLNTWRTKVAEETTAVIDIEARRQALKTKVKSAKTLSGIAAINWS